MAWLRERRLGALSTSDAGFLIAVEADPREANAATAAAGECQVRDWCCGGTVLPSASLVPKGSSASGLEGGDRLMLSCVGRGVI